MRASHTCAKTAGDGRASFVRRNAESGGFIEQDGFDVAVGQCFSCDETSETERREVQSGVALPDRCIEKLSFFGGECRRGIATMWCPRRKKVVEGLAW